MPTLYTTSQTANTPQPTNSSNVLWSGVPGTAIQPIISAIISDLENVLNHFSRTGIGSYTGGITSNEIADDAVLSRNLSITQNKVFYVGDVYDPNLLPNAGTEVGFKSNSTALTPDFIITADSVTNFVRIDFQFLIFLGCSGITLLQLGANFYFKLKRSTDPSFSSSTNIQYSNFFDRAVVDVVYNTGTGTKSLFWYDDTPKVLGQTYYYTIVCSKGPSGSGYSGFIFPYEAITFYQVT